MGNCSTEKGEYSDRVSTLPVLSGFTIGFEFVLL